MLAFRCGAGDEVGGHVRLLDGISFLFYFFVWDAKGEGGLDICQRGWYFIFIMKIYEKGGKPGDTGNKSSMKETHGKLIVS